MQSPPHPRYLLSFFFFSYSVHPRDLHSFPTRRSSDLIQEWLRTSPGDLTLQCDGLQFIDSTGLGLTVRLHNELAERGHRLVLTGLAPAVRRPFDVTNLTDVFEVREATP